MKYDGFKDALNYYMNRKDLDTTEVATVLHVDYATVRTWLRGDAKPKEFTQELYFNVLDEYTGKKYGIPFNSGLF